MKPQAETFESMARKTEGSRSSKESGTEDGTKGSLLSCFAQVWYMYSETSELKSPDSLNLRGFLILKLIRMLGSNL